MTRTKQLLSYFLILFFCSMPLFAKAENWELFNEGLDDVDDLVHLIGTKDLSAIYGITFGGIYKTNDHGANWKLIDNGIFANTYNRILIAPSQQSTLYLSSFIGGLYLSKNSGESWVKINTPNDSDRFYQLLAVHPNNPQEFYVADNSNWDGLDNLNFLFKTIDGGKTWEKQAGIFSVDYRIAEMVIDNENPLTRFLVLEARYSQNKHPNILLRSLDGGKSWQTMKMNLRKLAFSGRTLFGIFQNDLYQSNDVGITWIRLDIPKLDELNDFVVNENNQNEIYLSGSESFKTLDGGKTWKNIRIKGDLLLNQKNPEELFLASGNKIYQSMDGGKTFLPKIKGFTNIKVYSVAIDPQNNNFMYVVARNGLWMTGNSKTWQRITSLKDNFLDSVTIDPINPSTIYVVGFRHIHKSEDRGVTWQSSYKPSYSDSILVINPLNNNQLFIFGNVNRLDGSFGIIYRSDDQGKNWQKLSEIKSFINWLGFNPHQNNELFLSTSKTILKSSDNGATWSLVYNFDHFQDLLDITKIVFDPYNPNIIFALVESGVILKSNDAGKTWIRYTLGVHEYDRISSLIVDPKNTNTLYASTREEGINKVGHGLFVSRNGGLDWSPFNEKIKSLSIITLDINKKRELFAGTDGTGIFKTQLK